MLRTHGPGRARPGELAEGVVVVRHEVHYRAPLTFGFAPVLIECWVTEIRAASFTMAYEIFHETPGTAVVASSCGPPPCSRRTSSPPSAPGGSPPRSGSRWRPSSSPRARPADPAPPVPARRGRPLPGARPLLRRRRLRPRQQREVLRVLPGGPDPLMNARLWRDLPDDVHAHDVVVAQTDVDYKVPILFRPEPYDGGRGSRTSAPARPPSSRRSCDGDTLLCRARVVIVFFDAADPASTVPSGRLPRPAARRPSSTDRHRSWRTHSSVLTMNWAAWVT